METRGLEVGLHERGWRKINKHILVINLTKEMTLNSVEWKKGIHQGFVIVVPCWGLGYPYWLEWEEKTFLMDGLDPHNHASV